MTKQSTGSARADTGRAFVWALAVFAILCGVILMFLGKTDSGIAEQVEPQPIKSIIIDLDSAANALEDRNYGRTKTHLRSARKRLSQLNE